MLAEAYDQGKLSRRELILPICSTAADLFLHPPSMIFITAPILKSALWVYLGITVGSAVLRSVSLAVGRILSEGPRPLPCRGHAARGEPGKGQILDKTWKRFRRRIKNRMITVPIISVCTS